MGTPTAPTAGAVGLNGPGTSAPSRAQMSSGRDGSPTGERRALTQTPAPPQPPLVAHTGAEQRGRRTRASAIGPTARGPPTVHQGHAICAPKGGVHSTPPRTSRAPPTSPPGADRPRPWSRERGSERATHRAALRKTRTTPKQHVSDALPTARRVKGGVPAKVDCTARHLSPHTPLPHRLRAPTGHRPWSRERVSERATHRAALKNPNHAKAARL